MSEQDKAKEMGEALITHLKEVEDAKGLELLCSHFHHLENAINEIKELIRNETN